LFVFPTSVKASIFKEPPRIPGLTRHPSIARSSQHFKGRHKTLSSFRQLEQRIVNSAEHRHKNPQNPFPAQPGPTYVPGTGFPRGGTDDFRLPNPASS
jgi:hypothetical protein